MFAVITTKLFGNAYPEWFGTPGSSFYTLFQIPDSGKLVYGHSSSGDGNIHPRLGLFAPFIMIATFTMLYEELEKMSFSSFPIIVIAIKLGHK